MTGPVVEIVPLTEQHFPWARQLWEEAWGSDRVVSRGKVYHLADLPGLVALVEGEPSGLLVYCVEGDACEITSLNSTREGLGLGSRLLEAAAEQARQAGCRRLWLITTNDNMHALRFYQRRGFRLSALHAGAVDRARQIKPEIPLIGLDGIPIHDEIELVLDL